jgi:flagellar motor switch protein FliG
VSAEPRTGVRKAAIMLMAIGEAHSTELFKFLQEDEIERLAREIAALSGVPAELGERVLSEVHQMTVATEYIAAGGVEHARRLLTATLGPESARRILDRVMKSFTKNAGFTTLEKANSQQLGKFIIGEHPQTIALILAHLNAGSGAQLVAQLPEDMRADVLMRMATLEEISPEVISRISTVIDQRLKSLGGPSREQRGGVRAVAELFNRLDRGVSRAALERIERDSSEMAIQIRNFMFTFDDLSQIDDAGIREIVNRADKKGLTAALKGATEEIRQRFFKNMSKRASDMLKEEMELMGAVRLRDVEKAQQDIVGITRKLEEEGLITIGASAGEPYVV